MSVLESSRPGAASNGVPASVDDEIQIERNAGLVMATNNSSIVSKRSVEKLYLPEPHFFRYFVKKPIRRAPTINRGYWLRMRAVDWVVQQFLERPSEVGKVIINLGCGYDPLPFQWLHRDPVLCANTKFIDVDYDLLMETKRRIVCDTPKMYDLLHPIDKEERGHDKSVLIDAEEYAAIGCDLRNTRRLERLLKQVVDIEKCLVLCVGEVSITYMHTDAADNIISWSSNLSSDVTFCLLEQCSPDQADNPFTMTMMKHFAKLGTPLRSVMEYPSAHAQTQRFRKAGFTHVDCQNLWQLWADPRFLTPSQRVALDHVEPFDEWEEFALFASHYFLIVAHNREDALISERPRSRRDSTASLASDISARTSSPHKPANEWFALQYSKEPGDLCQRHHASAYTIPGQEAIGVHGGVGTRSRLSTTAVTRPRTVIGDHPVVPAPEMGARCCHTITPLDNGQNLLVGGRASPTHVFKDCWLQIGNTWKRVHDLPQPRYRHRVVCIALPDNSPGAICFGGKIDACTVATDILLWEPQTGWRALRATGADPVPRFAPLFMRLGYNHGLLFGGMRQDGIVCQGLWRWKLYIRSNTIVSIMFRPSNKIDASAGTWPWFARFGASYSMQRDEVLILGGIGKSGCIPKSYEILSMIGCFSNYKTNESELPLRLSCVTPIRGPDCPRPFLIGHSTINTRSGLSITMGGGATCFSFGNYFNTGIWILHDAEAGLPTEWVIVPTETAQLVNEEEKKPIENTQNHNKNAPTLVRRLRISSGEEFASSVRWLVPLVIDGLDFGSCVQKWDLPYLRRTVDPARRVVVHSAAARCMNFQKKDFQYQPMQFSEFLDKLNDRASHLYLRSLASEKPSIIPANLEADWPELCKDFSIPTPLSALKETMHSSPIRISNDINMWLHYDVMANVLFQVRGRRKLALFPPTDITKLEFPAGATTSETDFFHTPVPDKEPQLTIPPGTHPVIAYLEPGQALYIPPMWAHTGVSMKSDPVLSSEGMNGLSLQHANPQLTNGDSSQTTIGVTGQSEDNPYMSISVNVFFRNMPQSTYAAGRDVYGNRDLACYEDGRKMIEKLVTKFKTSHSESQMEAGSSLLLDWIPKDIRKTYLLRLAKELEQQAEIL